MSQRPPIQGIDGPGFADGEVPGWDNVHGLFVPKSAVIGLTSDDDTVTIADNGDGTLDLSAAPAGGATAIKDRLWTPAAGVTSIDEFNNNSISGSFTRVDASGGTGRVAWTEGGDVLSVGIAGGDASGELHAQMYPLSGVGGAPAAGDAFLTAFMIGNLTAANYAFGGLILADGTTYGAGKQVVATSHVGTTSRDHYLRTFTNYSTIASSVDQITNGASTGVTYFVRIVCTAANTWRRDISIDGVTWQIGTAAAYTITPTHVGVIASSFGTSTKSMVRYEYLRRQSGVS